MKNNLLIFGFGSFFKGNSKYQDIDLLIVHASNEYDSCRAAVSCKQWFEKQWGVISVMILSAQEECYFGFVSKSNAILLGEVSDENMEIGNLKILEILKGQI